MEAQGDWARGPASGPVRILPGASKARFSKGKESFLCLGVLYHTDML